MSVTAHKGYIFYQSCTGIGFDPEYACISKKEIKNYLKENPMPADPEYSEEDLIGDITGSSGIYTLSEKVRPETVSYIQDLLAELWN